MKHFFTNRYWASGALWVKLILLSGFLVPARAQAQSTTVVISELYVAGSSTAAFKNDFVELYNQTVTDINLSGYTLQYTPASGGGNYVAVPLIGKIIPANGFLLVQFGATAVSGNNLPTPDASTTTVLSNTGGRVALVNGTTALPDTSPSNAANIVDFVGYGPTATTYEGAAPTPTATADKSLERKAQASSTVASMGAGGSDLLRGNSYDTNNNPADFVTRNGPGPQNSASPPEELMPPTIFYNTKNPAGALDNLSTFSSTADGLGSSPTSFSIDYQRFIISGNPVTIAGNWNVGGIKSKVILLAGSTFTLPATADFSGLLDVGSGATLVVLNAAPGLMLGNLDPTSTVEYSQAASYTVPAPVGPGYGNLTLRNSTKMLAAGTTTVRGNLLVDNVGATGFNVFAGAPGSASQLNLGGNLALTGVVNFSSVADDRIALTATSTGTEQVLNGGGNTIKLLKVTLPDNQAGLTLATGTSNLELGSSTGGGYQLATGTVLTVSNNTLSFAANCKAAIASGTANAGALALSPGSCLSFGQHNNANLGTLLLTPASTQLTNLTVNATGGTSNNTLTLTSNLTVTGTLNLTAGTLAIGSGNVLTLNGPVVSASGLLRGASDADLLIGGSGALGTIRLPGGNGGQLQNFTLNRPGQTLSLGSSLVVNTAATLTAGILDLAGNSLTIKGAVATTATGLLKGFKTSNLNIEGAGALGTVGFTPTGGLLNALTLNRPGGTLAIVGAPLQVANPTLTSGILSLGAGVALTITGAAALPDPTVAQYAVTPTSILNFTGSGAIGTLAFVPGQDQLQGLTLSRLGGPVPTGQLVTNLTVTSLTLTRGNLYVQGAARLTVLPSGGVSGGGSFSHVNTLTQSAVTNSTTPTVALNFPLGVNGQYRGLTITVTDQMIGTAAYTAQQYESPAPARTLPATLARVSNIRYFNVVRESGGTSMLQSASIRLSYSASNDLVTPANANLLRVAMTDPADNTRWKDIGGTGGGTDITSASFPAGPLGNFALATDINTPVNTNPLPVELVRFGAVRQASGVAVTWATASEKNSAYFEVQRSLNGHEFATIASIPAQGTSTQPTAYAALDKTAPTAQLYYRLRQVDVDGTVAFSTVVAVAGTGKSLELALYPNPATDRVIATLPAAEGRSFRVLNAVGQVLDQGAAATANPAVDVRHLPAGTYFLELRSDAGRQTRRFVKND